MKFLKHDSSIFKMSAGLMAKIGYFILALGVGLPVVNQFVVLLCMAIFIVEKKSYFVQINALQTAFVAMLVELLRSLGILAVSLAWQTFSLPDSVVQVLLYIVVYGLVLVQVVVAVVGVLYTTRWRLIKFPLAGQLADWILSRWKTGVSKEEFLDPSTGDGVGLRRKM